MRVIGALAVVTLAVSGCTPEAPRPPAATSPAPSPSATAQPTRDPTPSPPAPTVDVSTLPSPSGWTPRPQTVDPTADRPDTAWAEERDVDEVMAVLASFACRDPGSLPLPERIVEATYYDSQGRNVVVERIEFAQSSQAEDFARQYLSGSVGCGAEPRGPSALHRAIDGQSWTEVVTVEDRVAQLITVQASLTRSEAEALPTAVHT